MVGLAILRRQAEVAFGVLNLTSQDYRLFPLDYYQETYRERTFALSPGSIFEVTYDAEQAPPFAEPKNALLAPSVVLAVDRRKHLALPPPAAYVANSGDDTVSVIALDSLAVIGTIGVGHAPQAVAASRMAHECMWLIMAPTTCR